MQNIHETMKPIYYLSRIFCLWPYKYTEFNKMQPLTKKDKLCAVFLVIFITVYFAWSTYQKTIFFIAEKGALMIITDTIYSFSEHLVTVYSIMMTNFSSRTYNLDVLLQLEKIDGHNVLLKKNIFEGAKKQFIIRVTTLMIFYCFITCADLTIYSNTLGYMFVLEYASCYFVQIIILIIYFQLNGKTELLTRYFRQVTTEIENIKELIINNGQLKLIDSPKVYFSPESFPKLLILHSKLSNLVTDFNSVHGIQILLLFCAVAGLSINSLCASAFVFTTSVSYAKANALEEMITVASKEVLNVVIHFVSFILLSKILIQTIHV